MEKKNEPKINQFPGGIKYYQIAEFYISPNSKISSPDDFKLNENFEVMCGYTIISRGMLQIDLKMRTLENCPLNITAHIRAKSKLSDKLVLGDDKKLYHSGMYTMLSLCSTILWLELKSLINTMSAKIVDHTMMLPILEFSHLSELYFENDVPEEYKKSGEKDFEKGWYKHTKSTKMHHFNINGNSECGRWRINGPEDIENLTRSKCKTCLKVVNNLNKEL